MSDCAIKKQVAGSGEVKNKGITAAQAQTVGINDTIEMTISEALRSLNEVIRFSGRL